MGMDMSSFVELRTSNGWEYQPDCEVFEFRNYGRFAFLANTMNLSDVPPLVSEPRGLPDDLSSEVWEFYDGDGSSDDGDKDYCCSFSWIGLRELLDFDYEATFFDRRNIDDWNDPPETKGPIVSYRMFLGDSFFQDLKRLKALGDPDHVRIVIWFSP